MESKVRTPRLAERAFLSLLVISCVLLFPAIAHAHAAYQSSDPEPRARLDEAPASVTVAYSEPPTTDSNFSVTDGCGRGVAGDIEVLNKTIEATVGDAQPGRWTVEWAVLSAVDGHTTRDRFTFTVAGEADCSAATADDEPTDEDPEPGGAGTSLVPYVLGAVLLVAIAAGVRAVSGRERG